MRFYFSRRGGFEILLHVPGIASGPLTKPPAGYVKGFCLRDVQSTYGSRIPAEELLTDDGIRRFSDFVAEKSKDRNHYFSIAMIDKGAMRIPCWAVTNVTAQEYVNPDTLIV